MGLRILGCPHPKLMKLRTEGQEWTHDLAEYANLLKRATIALCPLEDTLFNRCKGAAKPAEYSLGAGAAVIGSSVQYADVLSDQRGIVLAPSASAYEWADAINCYLADERLRYTHACNLRDHVATYQHVGRFTDFLTSLYTMEETSWRCSLRVQTA